MASRNLKKIRRPIEIEGKTVWISADNEQDYAEQLFAIMKNKSATAQAQSDLSASPVLKDYAEEWFTLHAPNIANATRIVYRREMDLHIIPAIGHLKLAEIRSSDIQQLFNNMKDVTTETKKKVRAVLSLILKKAYTDDLIVKNPLVGGSITVKGKASKETKPYKVEQMIFLIRNISKLSTQADRTYLAIHTMHPLRLEEVLGLQWQDVDLENGIFHIRRAATHPNRNLAAIVPLKTESSKRDIPINPQALTHLQPGKPEEFLVGGDTPLSYTQVRHMCQRIQRELNFEEKITPLRFRTTVLTDIYDQTKDVKQAQLAAGHTTPAMTLKYYVKGRNVDSSISQSIMSAYAIDAK